MVFTDAGPAAANLMGGMVNSWADSVPVLFFGGHVDKSRTASRFTKEIPFLDMFGPVRITMRASASSARSFGVTGSPLRASSTGCRPSTAAAPTSPLAATVVKVIDGDTIDLRFGDTIERVRLIGIDTPETVKPNTPVQCYGPEASARTKSLLPKGTAVTVERDLEPRDTYGRLLLYVHRAADQLFVNLDLAQGGFARALTIPPNTAHQNDFATAIDLARSGKVGLWGACAG